MRSLHILFILVVVTWLGFPLRAQEAISIGTRHTLFSHVLNEAREYWCMYLQPARVKKRKVIRFFICWTVILFFIRW